MPSGKHEAHAHPKGRLGAAKGSRQRVAIPPGHGEAGRHAHDDNRAGVAFVGGILGDLGADILKFQTAERAMHQVASEVIAGKDRGKRGRVLRVVPETNRLIVEGVNLIKRHTKPNPGKNIKGGIVEREASVHASNAQLVCPECGAQTRVGHKILGDGRKVRIFRSNKEVVDV